MKNLNILILLLGCLFFSSCDKFLSQESEDLIIPQTVTDYQELLQGEAYNKLESHLWFTDFLSDDIKEITGAFGFSDRRTPYKGYFTWQREMELKEDGSYTNDPSWDFLYKVVMLANICLEDADGLDSKPADIAFLKGEAHFLRAYSYFLLVNLYGKPYSEASSSSDLGVPLNLVAHVQDKLFSRASVLEVYNQIEDDLSQAIDAFTQSGQTSTEYHANLDVCNFLFSRVYLYQKNWDKAIEYADKVLANYSVLNDISGNNIDENTPFYIKANPEIIFSYGGTEKHILFQSSPGQFGASDALVALYDLDDNRKLNYVKSTSSGPGGGGPGGGGPGPGGPGPGGPGPAPAEDFVPNKFEAYADSYFKAFRVSEMYLNRAEAYAEKGQYTSAINDIRFLRSNRVQSDMLNLVEDETLIQAVRDERRRELCFETHRWFDLRRWGQPRIEHVYTLLSGDFAPLGVETYVLEENDPAYTLQIPFSVRQFNPAMSINDRPERNPIIN